VVILLGLGLRLRGIDFGLPYLYHPDERFVVDSVRQILATGNMNPYWFGWPGSFVTYILAGLYAVILGVYSVYCFFRGDAHSFVGFESLLSGDLALAPEILNLTGRLLMTVFAIITICFVYLVGKKIFNRTVGILASFCLAIAPLHVGPSRVIRPDIPATMLILCSVYFLLLFIEQNTKSKFLIISSLLVGFSVAAKYTSGIVLLPVLVYCSILDSRQDRTSKDIYLSDFVKIKTNLSKALVFSFIGFFILAPFVILNFEHALRAINYEMRATHFGSERLPAMQNFLWLGKKVLVEGIGGAFFAVFACLGLFMAILKRSLKTYIFLIFPLAFYLFITFFGQLRWARWLIPVLPFEAILFGAGFYGLYKHITHRKVFVNYKGIIVFLFIAILAGGSAPALVGGIKQGSKLSRTDVRTIAKEWIEENLPQGSSVAYEYYAPHLHVNPRSDLVLLNTAWEQIVSRPISYYLDRDIDYVIVTSSFKDLYLKEPGRYAKEIQRYEDLGKKAELIKLFSYKNNPGPTIEVYKLKRSFNR